MKEAYRIHQELVRGREEVSLNRRLLRDPDVLEVFCREYLKLLDYVVYKQTGAKARPRTDRDRIKAMFDRSHIPYDEPDPERLRVGPTLFVFRPTGKLTHVFATEPGRPRIRVIRRARRT